MSTQAATKAAELMGDKAHLVSLPIGHFDIYRGEPFEHAVRDQTEFLIRHLEVS